MKLTENTVNVSLRTELINTITEMGHPKEFAELVAKNLGSDKAMIRMLGYLYPKMIPFLNTVREKAL